MGFRTLLLLDSVVDRLSDDLAVLDPLSSPPIRLRPAAPGEQRHRFVSPARLRVRAGPCRDLWRDGPHIWQPSPRSSRRAAGAPASSSGDPALPARPPAACR